MCVCLCVCGNSGLISVATDGGMAGWTNLCGASCREEVAARGVGTVCV